VCGSTGNSRFGVEHLDPPHPVVLRDDVFWPFEYPNGWLREGRDWTEAYLLQAFLAHNDAWQIELNCSWLWQHDRALFPEEADSPPGSLWLAARRCVNPGARQPWLDVIIGSARSEA
jgi:hypothetical protein